MAQYKETVNTEKALNLIAKMLAGEIEQIDFTKIKVSDKDYSLLSVEELQKLETLEEVKQETLVSEKVLLDDNTVNVHGIIYNTDLENSYYLRTIGLYANDPDEGEILYSITPASHADYVPTPNGNNITTLILDLKTVISGAIVNLQGNPSALVDVSMLNKKLDRGEGLEEEFDTGVKIVNELKKKQNKEDSSLLTTVKNIVGAINELFSNKLEKGGYTGNAKNLNDEISKKASSTQLGRMIVGTGLTDDGNGRVSHSTGAGNNHIPANGATGNFLKWLSNGVAQWANITWSDITGKPSTFTPSSHTHTKANITDFPTSIKNPYALSIQLNNGTANTYDGSAGISINITASGIGAAASSHTHDDRYYTESEVNTKLSGKADTSHTHDDRYYTESEVNTKLSGKADTSHTHDDRYYTESEIDTKFKNFCPFPVNSLYLSLGSENPSTLWLGTTWQKQEGRFLLGSSSSYSLGATGGASSIALSVANMPSHTHSASQSAHTHTQPTHFHYVFNNDTSGNNVTNSTIATKSGPSNIYAGYDIKGTTNVAVNGKTSNNGGDTTGSSTPSISVGSTGSGTAFSIMPPYLVVNIWKRLS